MTEPQKPLTLKVLSSTWSPPSLMDIVFQGGLTENLHMTHFLIAFFLTAQSFAGGQAKPTPTPNPSPIPKPFSGIHFAPVTNYTASELEILSIAESLANTLVHSRCFESFMLKRDLIQKNNLSTQEIIEKIQNTQMTVPLKMYSEPGSGVIGYRTPPSLTIYTNRPYIAGSTACARASNLTHEWSHDLGFTHDFERTERRPRSIPYSLNQAFVECCSCVGIKACKVKP